MSFWKDRAPLDRFRVGLLIAVAAFTAAVAVLAFWVSFEAISVYAVRIGAFPKRLGWAAPLLVDSFTLLGTAFLLWLALSGERLRSMFDHWYAWVLVAIATAASAFLNYKHVAPKAPREAPWIAGAVPVVLLAAVHLLLLLLLRVLELGKPASVNPPAEVGERVPGPHTQAPAPTSRAAASSRPVKAAVVAGRESPTFTSSPRVQPHSGGAPAPGESTPELEPARRALVIEHAYDDGGERMGDRRVRAALEAAGHVVPRAVVRQALAELPERRNGHKVVAQ